MKDHPFGRIHAILTERCPVCLEGRMFRGMFAMNETCPVCGHRFEREPGFFQGAMYVSYGLGVGEAFILVLLANAFLTPRIGLIGAIVAVLVVHLAFVPALFRYSRVLWAHLNIGTLERADRPALGGRRAG
jgi:uncharacterized protein (DUF983 family)